ncbi:ABC transporter permease [Actinokineospora sp. HUAS TT18]|uniref:ABC transporter permease n=1 Tax=Actinokineospora sp. HUAS TT18 TaxID=3447451 RepID=UPI003F51EFDD
MTTTQPTGRVLSPVRASFLVFDSFWTWYRRNWRASVTSSFLQPALYLVALGFGFGSQVRPGPATLGLPYVQYLAPALLVASMMQIAAFESTYPVLSAFRWQQTYLAITATPITPGQVLGGQLTWIAARLGFSAVAFALIAAVLGAVTGPAIVWSVFIAVLTGMAVSAPIVAYSATLESEGQGFNVLFRFIIIPMTLFAGTFFPVEQLPGWVRPLVWITPLWHGTELSRDLTFGTVEPLQALGHLTYLVALLALGAYLARRVFNRKLAV